MNLKSATRWQKLELILGTKQAMVVEKTLQGFPKELHKFVNYCRSLKFEKQVRNQSRTSFAIFIQAGLHVSPKFAA